MSATQSVQTFGKKKTATAVALAKVSQSVGRAGERASDWKTDHTQNTRGARTQEGKGLIKINGVPLSLYGTPILRGKLYEPVLLLQQFVSSTTSLGSPLERVDIRLRVSGGGHTSQLYALRQAIAKAVVAYVAKYEDAASALEIRKVLVAYDRTLLVADPRRCEPKKFGGKGARSRFQKSCVQLSSLLLVCWSDLCSDPPVFFSCARNQLPLKGLGRNGKENKGKREGGGGEAEEEERSCRRCATEKESGGGWFYILQGLPTFSPNTQQHLPGTTATLFSLLVCLSTVSNPIPTSWTCCLSTRREPRRKETGRKMWRICGTRRFTLRSAVGDGSVAAVVSVLGWGVVGFAGRWLSVSHSLPFYLPFPTF